MSAHGEGALVILDYIYRELAQMNVHLQQLAEQATRKNNKDELVYETYLNAVSSATTATTPAPSPPGASITLPSPDVAVNHYR